MFVKKMFVKYLVFLICLDDVDFDIVMVCKLFYFLFFCFYKNVFCYICNLFKQNLLINLCNYMGYWDVDDLLIKYVCSDGGIFFMIYFYKNFYCFFCNIVIYLMFD